MIAWGLNDEDDDDDHDEGVWPWVSKRNQSLPDNIWMTTNSSCTPGDALKNNSACDCSVRNDRRIPVNQNSTCQSKRHLSIKTAPINQNNTCQSKRHLSIKTAPINQNNTCQSKQHLSIKTTPVNQNNTCQSKQHLSIKTAPVNQNSTYQSKQHLSIKTTPVNQNSTCQSKQHLSIKTAPVNQNNTCQSRCTRTHYTHAHVSLITHKLWTSNQIYIKETFVRYLLDSRWSDRRETLQVNRVCHEHENSQGPMLIALC